ncbi:MAG: outer membrane beta-barrel protein [Pseudomonadota bacterium]
MKRVLGPACAAMLIAGSANAVEIAIYTGFQTAPHSDVDIFDNSGSSLIEDSFNAGWDGRSFEMPPYYGIRATWWRNENLGYAIEFTHAKVYADDETLDETGFSEFEFTDGLNSIIASVRYRWPNAWGNFTPYVNGGLGVSIPYVEVQTAPDAEATEGLQYGGLAGAVALGAHFDMNERWGLFGEYRFSYQEVDVDLDGGGSVDTNIITNALNIGVSYNF